jgi:hypothetical protein
MKYHNIVFYQSHTSTSPIPSPLHDKGTGSLMLTPPTRHPHSTLVTNVTFNVTFARLDPRHLFFTRVIFPIDFGSVTYEVCSETGPVTL